MTSLRLGVLGCADVAVRRVLPAVARAGGRVVATAVAGRDPDRTRRVADRFGAAAVGGYPALLERDDVDAVYVPLPSALHAEWIERALDHGLHVLAEKPLTTTPERTAALVDRASALGLVLAENFMFTQHTQHDTVRRLLAEGAVGELRTLSATFAIPARPPGDIRLCAALGGGALLDNGAYPVHVARMYLGDRLEVAGSVLRRPQEAEVDLGGTAVLRRHDGVSALLSFGMDDAYRADYRLDGTRGSLEVVHAFTPPEHHRPLLRLRTQDRVEEITLPAHDQFAASLVRFADRVAAGSEDPVRAAGSIAQAGLVEDIRVAAGAPAPRPDAAAPR